MTKFVEFECEWCKDSGTIARFTRTGGYKCAGPVPEDARGCYEDICERCPEGRKAQREIDAPVHKDAGGQIGMNGECLACTAEAGEACR